jgi:hypothetical protein
VDYFTTDITVSAAAEHAAATITSGTGSHSLSIGDNAIEVIVEAEDASTKTYTITVTRQPAVARTFRARTVTDDTWYNVSSKLLGSGDHVEVFVEDGHGITSATAQAIADEFDANIYDLIRDNFATESDVDDNGKVTLLLLDIVDGFDGSGGYVAGYFDPTHLFSAGSEPNSNEAEMLFMDVDPAVPASDEFYSTVAHEMQHLVNFAATFLVDSTLQDLWINEGLSSGAEYLYAGEQITSRIAYYNNDPVGTIANGNNFYIWNGYWESTTGGSDVLANYATVYLFFQWLRIHASNDTVIYSDILDSSYRDYRAVVNAAELRIDSSLDTWEKLLGSWLQANQLTDRGATGLKSYGGEISVAPWYISTTGGEGALLSSGEGIAVATESGEFDYPGGSGSSIRYRGVDWSSHAVDSTGTTYSGDVVIVFNTNTLIASNDPVEVAILPAVTSPLPSIMLNTVSSDPSAMPDSYPIGVRFTPDGESIADGESQPVEFEGRGRR